MRTFLVNNRLLFWCATWQHFSYSECLIWKLSVWYNFFASVINEIVLNTCSDNLQTFLYKCMMCDKICNSGIHMCILVNWMPQDDCQLGWSKFLNLMTVISVGKIFILDHILWFVSYVTQNLGWPNCLNFIYIYGHVGCYIFLLVCGW
jgi:hypothetical protein